MKTLWFGAAILLSLFSVSRAEAGAIYSTTDLGTSDQLEANANGQVYGVANSTGSVVYAFDKAPVTAIDVGPINIGNAQYQYLTLEIGTHQVGYINAISPVLGVFLYPTGQGYSSGWFISAGGFSGNSPLLDVNSQGQYVGISQFYGKAGTYAAFSTLDGYSHDYTDTTQVANNLNSYIVTIPGVSLTSAFKIDDLGRILAEGSDGHNYLLTPTSLGSPSTVPEPSTVIMLGMASGLFALRSISRKPCRVGTAHQS